MATSTPKQPRRFDFTLTLWRNNAVEIRKAERRDLEALGRLGAMLLRTHYAFDRQRFLAPGEGAEQSYSSFLGRMLD
jgi:hypothetical protein